MPKLFAVSAKEQREAVGSLVAGDTWRGLKLKCEPKQVAADGKQPRQCWPGTDLCMDDDDAQSAGAKKPAFSLECVCDAHRPRIATRTTVAWLDAAAAATLVSYAAANGHSIKAAKGASLAACRVEGSNAVHLPVQPRQQLSRRSKRQRSEAEGGDGSPLKRQRSRQQHTQQATVVPASAPLSGAAEVDATTVAGVDDALAPMREAIHTASGAAQAASVVQQVVDVLRATEGSSGSASVPTGVAEASLEEVLVALKLSEAPLDLVAAVLRCVCVAARCVSSLMPRVFGVLNVVVVHAVKQVLLLL